MAIPKTEKARRNALITQRMGVSSIIPPEIRLMIARRKMRPILQDVKARKSMESLGPSFIRGFKKDDIERLRKTPKPKLP